MYTAGVIAATALALSSVDLESTKSRTQSCVDMGGYTKCFQVSPSPIRYANNACDGWELDICNGNPYNFPRDETINALADVATNEFIREITGYEEDKIKWIDQQTLRQNIAILLVASQESDLDNEETAYVLATAMGESKLGAITGGYYASNTEHSPMWEVTDREDAESMYGKDTDAGKALGNDQKYDGFTYRGRGFCQLTGKDNYKDFNRIFGDKYYGDQDDVNIFLDSTTKCNNG